MKSRLKYRAGPARTGTGQVPHRGPQEARCWQVTVMSLYRAVQKMRDTTHHGKEHAIDQASHLAECRWRRNGHVKSEHEKKPAHQPNCIPSSFIDPHTVVRHLAQSRSQECNWPGVAILQQQLIPRGGLPGKRSGWQASKRRRARSKDTPTGTSIARTANEPGCDIPDSAAGKMREEVYDVLNPAVHLGARLGRIRDDPDDDENNYHPGQDLAYQGPLPPLYDEISLPQMPSLAEVTSTVSLSSQVKPGVSVSI